MTIRMEYTAATEPYLQAIYTCSGANIIDSHLISADNLDPQQTNLAMRIGIAPDLMAPSFQIASDSIQVIVNAGNPLEQLGLEQIRAIFTGQIQNWSDLQGQDGPVEIWVYSSGEDIEHLFEQSALQGTPITSLAHLAVSPEAMVKAVANNPNAIGILTKSWKADGIKSLITAADEPVLIYSASEPERAIREIINCLQK